MSCFMFLYFSLFVKFGFKNPFNTDTSGSLWQIYQSPSLILFDCLNFIIHCLLPLVILDYIFIINGILINKISNIHPIFI
ncbi:hypothetical protein HanPI659440_Chr03g0116941 [Helianthus annuus]|nr:hypothetical protein HanPI659440_Chr03g0116941 [Helianthus annuus]